MLNVETLVDHPGALADRFARRLEGLARESIGAAGLISLALPGGSVADVFFPVLARAALDWGRVHFFWGDERAVAPDHPDSNYAVARRLLLEPVAAAPSAVHRMRADEPDLDQAARGYETELRQALGDGALDVVLLGMGPDGHVCSLFEGHPALAEASRFAIPVTDSPKPPPRRITLTRPALRAAKLVVLAAFGAAKAEVVRAVLRDPESTLPAGIVMREARAALALLDPPAASRLG